MTLISASLLVAAGVCIGWWFLPQPQKLYDLIGKHKKPRMIMMIVIGVLLLAALITGFIARGTPPVA